MADLALDLGVDGVELPVRDGFQITPENAADTLPAAKDIFSEKGLAVAAVSADPTDEIIQLMGDAEIPVLRVMVPVNMGQGYFKSVQSVKDKIISLGDVLRANKVRIGIQNHHSYFIGSAVGVMDLIRDLPEDIAGAVPDFAHCQLSGEPVDMALDILNNRILYMNLKNAVRELCPVSETQDTVWQIRWTEGREGFCSWSSVVTELIKAECLKDICLHAEYSDGKNLLEGDDVIPLIRRDIAYVKELLERYV
ncbi:MAG: sugar phosphate isomerase/epimerase [Spirochaetales bacterium]|nr:sugar phosphate isomerase/epimerase [Spirochaetales bacterium]